MASHKCGVLWWDVGSSYQFGASIFKVRLAAMLPGPVISRTLSSRKNQELPKGYAEL
jgi:hypothetical protein